MKATSFTHPDVIGVIVGIVGILLACVFYIRSEEQIKPRIFIEMTTLVGKWFASRISSVIRSPWPARHEDLGIRPCRLPH